MKLTFVLALIFIMRFSSGIISQEFEHSVNKGNYFSKDTITTKVDSSRTDSLKQPKKAYKPLLFVSGTKLDSTQKTFTLTQPQIEKKDYTFTGDLFRYVPFGMVKDLGAMGQPDEALIYGQGYGDIGYIVDGVPYNNRLTNSLETAHIQSESIDTIEILPVYKGFFYGRQNEPAGVNIVTRKRFDSKALTRIRFYQAPDEEGFVDIFFNRLLTKKINLTLDLTNNSVQSRYENSGSGGWKASGRIDYFLFKNFTISANYSYYRLETDLNGGVDLDSIRNNQSPLQTQEILYDPLIAPVKATSRYHRNLRHYFNVVINNELLKGAPMRLIIYRDYASHKYRQNLDLSANETRIVNNNEHSVYGFDFNQKFNVPLLDFEITFNYEDISYDAGILGSNLTETNLSAGIKASQSILNELISFSVFSKIFKSGDLGYTGFGGEGSIKLDNFSVFGGTSYFENPFSPIQEYYLTDESGEVKTKNFAFQTGASYNPANITAGVSYFYLNRQNYPFAVRLQDADSLTQNQINYYLDDNKEIHGVNCNIKVSFWKLKAEVNSSYYIGENDIENYSLPNWTAFAGLYYVDSLFENNLKLKGGINYFANSSKSYFNYDFQHFTGYTKEISSSGRLVNISNSELPSHHRLDLFVAGKIQNRATVYVAFENLLDVDFYDVPYYPVRGRNFRFGLAWELFN